MPNIKSAAKRVKVTARQRSVNVSRHSNLKTFIKKAFASITAGKPEAQADLIQAVKKIDKAAGKGVIHKNQAARRKSRLAKKLNAMAKQ